MNHGEPNPKFNYPDSFCGKSFLYKEPVKKGEEGNDETCVYHSGHFNFKNKKTKEGKWTCCGSEDIEG